MNLLSIVFAYHNHIHSTILFLLYGFRIEMRHTQKRKQRRNNTLKRSSYHWGHHLCMDASQCDPDAIRSKQVIHDFATELVERIHMKAYGKPRIIRFGTADKKGYTLVQLIETSDITCHFVEDTNAAYLDVFSCKLFSPKIAIQVFDKYFHSGSKRVRFFHRLAQ